MSDLEIREGAIDASACLSEGWALIKPYYGTFLGMTVTMILIGIALNFIPFNIGDIINAVIGAPLLCGIYYALILRLRGENVSFSMMFEGFNRFLPAFLVTLLSTIPLLTLGAAAYFFVALSPPAPSASGVGDLSSILGQQFTAAAVISFVAAYLVTIALSILLFFALPLIADHNLGFVDAVKYSFAGASANLGGLIVLFLLEFLVMLVSLLAFCIGFLFAMPLIYAANIIAYRRVFPASQPTFFNEPPRPDAYGGVYGSPQ